MRLIPFDDSQLRQAQSRFLDGHALPAGLLPQAISRSWRRLRAAGVTPGNKAIFDDVVNYPKSSSDIDLLKVALPEMDALHRMLNSPNWGVLCIDAAGNIAGSHHHSHNAPRAIRHSLRVGNTIAEGAVGTNAPACVLADGEPVIVQGAQHFLDDLGGYVCAAVPLFDPQGALAGVLDVTGQGVRLPNALFGHITHAAQAIENRMFHALRDVDLWGIHHMSAFLGTPAEGLLAVSRETGRVMAVNRAACELLDMARDELSGVLLDQLLDVRRGGELPADAPILCFANGGLIHARFYRDPPRTFVSRVSRAETSPSRRSGIEAPAMVGDDPAFLDATRMAARAFAQAIPVLILGETGTGKEQVARTLHAQHGADKPFVAINCSAIPESLMESEIFGYADGAFTGARKGGAAGKLEQADGGTLFLDEIGDASPAFQAKLLRVLQEGRFTKLGSEREVSVNFNVISATHRDLKAMIAERDFREDLYYRLNGIAVKLPPLRDRTDTEMLIDVLLERQAAARGTEASLLPEAKRALVRHSWPGNVRQLHQALKAAVALADDPEAIGLGDFPADLREELGSASGPAMQLVQPDFESVRHDLIRATLVRTGNNVAKTARLLDISRTTVYKYLKQVRH